MQPFPKKETPTGALTPSCNPHQTEKQSQPIGPYSSTTHLHTRLAPKSLPHHYLPPTRPANPWKCRNNLDVLGKNQTTEFLLKKKLTCDFRRQKNLWDIPCKDRVPLLKGDETFHSWQSTVDPNNRGLTHEATCTSSISLIANISIISEIVCNDVPVKPWYLTTV